MAAGRYSFLIEQGATTDFELAYKDSDGNPIDLTGYSARMHIREQIADTVPVLTLTSSIEADGTGINLSGSSGANPPTSGTLGIYISSDQTAQLDFEEGYYDLEIAVVNAGYERVTRVLEGKVKLSKNITR